MLCPPYAVLLLKKKVILWASKFQPTFFHISVSVYFGFEMTKYVIQVYDHNYQILQDLVNFPQLKLSAAAEVWKMACAFFANKWLFTHQKHKSEHPHIYQFICDIFKCLAWGTKLNIKLFSGFQLSYLIKEVFYGYGLFSQYIARKKKKSPNQTKIKGYICVQLDF